MSRTSKFLAGALAVAVFYAMLLNGCSGPKSASSDPSPNPTPGPQNTPQLAVDFASFCPSPIVVGDGQFCVIQPSKTDASIYDSDPLAGKKKLGFGYHVIGFPKDLSKVKGIWVHFTGSYGMPYDQFSSGTELEKMMSYVWYNEIMSQGYIVIGVAYENQQSVNGDLCGSGPPPGGSTTYVPLPGDNVDDCAGQVRHEILEGADYSSIISVDSANGVYNRLEKLFAYLEPHVQNFPPGITSTNVDWSKIMVSGHSQGTGHAYYLAKNVGVKGACFISGPFDNADTVNRDPKNIIADWFLAPGNLSDVNKMGSFVVTSDGFYKSFVKGWGVIGLIKGTEWFEYDPNAVGNSSTVTDGWGNSINLLDPANNYVAAHGAAVGAIEFAPLRAQACFR